MMFDYCAFDICSLGLLSSKKKKKKKKRCKQEICLKKDKRLRLNDGCFEFFFFFFFLENKDKSQQTHHTTLKQGRFNVDSSLDVEFTLFQRCVFAGLRL